MALWSDLQIRVLYLLPHKKIEDGFRISRPHFVILS